MARGPTYYLAEIGSSTIGTLSLVHYPNNNLCIEWKPNEFLIADADANEQDWSLVDTISRRRRTDSESIAFSTASGATPPPTQSASRVLRTKIVDLKQIEILKNGNHILLMHRLDHSKNSEYFFQHGNADGFVRNMQSAHCLMRSRHNRNIYEINFDVQFDRDKLQKTFAELRIDDIKGPAGIWGLVRNPIGPAIDFLAKISDVYTVLPNVVGTGGNTSPADTNSSSMVASSNDEYEYLSTSPRQLPQMENNQKYDSTEEYKMPVRCSVVRGGKLMPKQWSEYLSEDGRITDVDRIKEQIFRGGIEPSLRREVWKYLLGYFKWDETREECLERQRRLNKEYFQMKLQWLSLSPVQEANFSNFRDRKVQIIKDVLRTDRTLPFFAGENNPNGDLLQDILMTYVMYNFDVGYVQGMSDLLAPILCTMEDEVDAFWCFVGFMDLVYTNFDLDQAGMKRQLQDLNKLMALANPRLFNYFKEHDSENMYFCFRWLLVWFKREFSQEDIMELWEVLWTGFPCINFYLIVSVAILDDQMNIFIDNNYEFNEILKHVNELSNKLDLNQILRRAESVYLQIKMAENLKDDVRVIIGEPTVEEELEKFDYGDSLDRSPQQRLLELQNQCKKDKEDELEFQRKLDEACERSMYGSFY